MKPCSITAVFRLRSSSCAEPGTSSLKSRRSFLLHAIFPDNEPDEILFILSKKTPRKEPCYGGQAGSTVLLFLITGSAEPLSFAA